MNREIKEIVVLSVVLSRVIYPGENVLEGCKKLVALGVLPPEAIGETEAAIKGGLIDWWGNGIPHASGAARLRPPADIKLSKSTWYTQNI